MHCENDSVALHLALKALSADYRACLPVLAGRVTALDTAASAGDACAWASLRDELHRAAANGGTMGCTALSAVARAALQLIDAGAAPTELRSALGAVVEAMRESAAARPLRVEAWAPVQREDALSA